MQLLILGGTYEAARLAQALSHRADLAPVLSLAGRTALPAPAPIPVRSGGFGGVDGLASYLAAEGVAAVVDATHPFAARISEHAVQACAARGTPLARLTRPAWRPNPGDGWRLVPDLDAAAEALGPVPRRVFLTSGRLGLKSFRGAPQHRYLLRSIDPPAADDCPPDCEVLLARGPFGRADEEALMRRHGVEILVSKNSGGAGSAKIEAARTLGLKVVMVERPAEAYTVDRFHDLADTLDWIERHRSAPELRGVSIQRRPAPPST